MSGTYITMKKASCWAFTLQCTTSFYPKEARFRLFEYTHFRHQDSEFREVNVCIITDTGSESVKLLSHTVDPLSHLVDLG